MTSLSVKALRHYHDVGLLAPAAVDPATSYRSYATGQVASAQIIRRFRDLGMPVDELRSMLHAPDSAARNATIIAHLERMEHKLEQTQDTVASLRALLAATLAPLQVRRRYEPATPALAVVERVSSADVVAWWVGAFTELHAALRQGGVRRTGPDGALFPDEFFREEARELVAFVPVAAPVAAAGRLRAYEVPAVQLAVALHRGPFSDLDRTYGALGTWVAERALGAPGPVRERYLPLGDENDLLRHHTEICWPSPGLVRGHPRVYRGVCDADQH